MKKVLLIITLVLSLLVFKNVDAADYEMKELIPAGITTTVRGNIFLYKNIKYENGEITFEKIRNNSMEDHALTISIGLFDKDRLNIGTIFYCREDNSVKTKTGIENYTIYVDREYLGEGKSTNDIKYISVLNQNENCRKEGSHEFLGQKVEDIGVHKEVKRTGDIKLVIIIFTVVGLVLLGLFAYRFAFTDEFQNMDGNDIRNAYKKANLEQKEKNIDEAYKQMKDEERSSQEDVLEFQEINTVEDNNNNSQQQDTEVDIRDFYK